MSIEIIHQPTTKVWLNLEDIENYTLDITHDDKIGIFIKNKFVNFSGTIILYEKDEYNPYNKISFNEGLLHSFDDEPALEDNLTKMWMKNGLPHRIGGPSYITIRYSHHIKWAIEGKYYNYNTYLDMIDDDKRIMVILKYANR